MELVVLICRVRLIMKNSKKYVLQQYFIPEDRVEEKVKEDNVPYDKWKERGLLTTCIGSKVNYSDVTSWFYQLHRDYDISTLWVGYDPWRKSILD